jgi:hypothetical protein
MNWLLVFFPRTVPRAALVHCYREVLSGCGLTVVVGWDGRDMQHEWDKSARGFWWGIMKKRDKSEDLGVDVKVILKWVLIKQRRRAWTGFLWLKIGPSGGLW